MSPAMSVQKVLSAHIYCLTEHEAPQFLSKTDWEIAGTASMAGQHLSARLGFHPRWLADKCCPAATAEDSHTLSKPV